MLEGGVQIYPQEQINQLSDNCRKYCKKTSSMPVVNILLPVWRGVIRPSLKEAMNTER